MDSVRSVLRPMRDMGANDHACTSLKKSNIREIWPRSAEAMTGRRDIWQGTQMKLPMSRTSRHTPRSERHPLNGRVRVRE